MKSESPDKSVLGGDEEEKGGLGDKSEFEMSMAQLEEDKEGGHQVAEVSVLS